MRGVREGNGVGVWKAIIKGWDVLKSMFCFIVENERRVKFWKDRCCDDLSLEEAFLMLFFIASNKEG